MSKENENQEPTNESQEPTNESQEPVGENKETTNPSDLPEDLQNAVDAYNKENNAEEKPPVDATSDQKKVEPPDDNNQEEEDNSEQPTETSGPAFDDVLLDRAKVNGITEEEAKTFATPEALTQALNLYEKKRVSVPEKKDEVKSQEEILAGLNLELDPEHMDEETIVKTFKAMNEHYGKQVTDLNTVVAQFREREVQTRHEAIVGNFETMVNGLGKEYEPYLGKGGLKEVNNLQVDTRSRIFDTMGTLENSFTTQGRQVTDKELFDMACRVELGDKVEAFARQKVTNEVLKRRNSAILPPSAKGSGGKAANSELDNVKNILQDPNYEYKGS